eukprot:scaffold313042_cov43-Prasinocladus_malaysianus.AAC.1
MGDSRAQHCAGTSGNILKDFSRALLATATVACSPVHLRSHNGSVYLGTCSLCSGGCNDIVTQ